MTARAEETRRSAATRPRKTRLGGPGWLVTYADLMTILVCFFVLIISYSIQDEVKMEVVAGSMRDAFGIAEQRRYAGEVTLEGAPEQRQPGNIRPIENPTSTGLVDRPAGAPAAARSLSDEAQGRHAAETERLRRAAERLERAILTHPLLKDQAEAITIELAEEGLQVIVVDRDGAAMFAPGGAIPTARAQALLREIAAVIAPLPNRISVVGHADANGGPGYSPFSLTADRANAARALLERSGLPKERISGVVGKGAADPLYPEDPYAAGNRRIEIILEKSAPLLPEERFL